MILLERLAERGRRGREEGREAERVEERRGEIPELRGREVEEMLVGVQIFLGILCGDLLHHLHVV